MSKILFVCTGNSARSQMAEGFADLGATLPRGPAWQSLILEGILTFFLMFVIMAMATDSRAVGNSAALAIGATVGLEALFAGPISGASMNPARSFGPALSSGAVRAPAPPAQPSHGGGLGGGRRGPLRRSSGLTAHQWIYWVGPLLGATLGSMTYARFRD